VLEQLTMRRAQAGFTMIELMTGIVIVGILAVLAIPPVGEQLARRRLEGVATDLTTDLQFARSQAVSSRGDVRFRTTSTTTYVIDNAGGTVTHKTVTLPAGITVTNGITVTYDALRGASAAARTFALASTQTSATMQVDVNTMGRASICSPSGSLKGYTTC
jgi:type IV fimbrial biogenesis protein FimT